MLQTVGVTGFTVFQLLKEQGKQTGDWEGSKFTPSPRSGGRG